MEDITLEILEVTSSSTSTSKLSPTNHLAVHGIVEGTADWSTSARCVAKSSTCDSDVNLIRSLQKDVILASSTECRASEMTVGNMNGNESQSDVTTSRVGVLQLRPTSLDYDLVHFVFNPNVIQGAKSARINRWRYVRHSRNHQGVRGPRSSLPRSLFWRRDRGKMTLANYHWSLLKLSRSKTWVVENCTDTTAERMVSPETNTAKMCETAKQNIAQLNCSIDLHRTPQARESADIYRPDFSEALTRTDDLLMCSQREDFTQAFVELPNAASSPVRSLDRYAQDIHHQGEGQMNLTSPIPLASNSIDKINFSESSSSTVSYPPCMIQMDSSAIPSTNTTFSLTEGESTFSPGGEERLKDAADVQMEDEKDVDLAQVFPPHMVAACVAVWCCGFVCGLIAFVLAVLSSRRADKEGVEDGADGGIGRGARRLALASCFCSLLGALSGLAVLALVLVWSVRGAADQQHILPSL